MEQKEIYFHVGTGKTGSTFLQERVFPFFKKIYYLPTVRYKHCKKILPKLEDKRILISREFDQQLEDEIKWFSKDYPHAKPIIVFRTHGSYIASQYRRFVKNGFRGDFYAFFDVKNDQGFFKIKDLDYSHQISLLEEYFEQKPLVLAYNELREDAVAYVNKLAREVNAEVDTNEINFSKFHASYSEKQLKGMQALGKVINMRKRKYSSIKALHFIAHLGMSAIRYSSLFIIKWLPASFFSKAPLIPKEALEEVDAYFKNDWDNCMNYIQKQELK